MLHYTGAKSLRARAACRVPHAARRTPHADLVLFVQRSPVIAGAPAA